jgi:hypothetical protein
MADCDTGQCPPLGQEPQQAPVYHAPAAVTATSHADASRPHDPLDPATFVPPLPGSPPAITIEFCDRVRTQVPLFLIDALINLSHCLPSVDGMSPLSDNRPLLCIARNSIDRPLVFLS